MTAETETVKKTSQPQVLRQGKASEAVYGLGLIGALVYYLSHATSLWLGLLGIIKAVFWPAVLVYEILKHLSL